MSRTDQIEETSTAGSLGDAVEIMSEANRIGKENGESSIARVLERRIQNSDEGTIGTSVPHKRGDRLWPIEWWLDTLFKRRDIPVSERLDLIFDTVDDWLLERKFEQPNRVFELLDIEYFSESLEQTDLTIGFLTVTNGAQEHLDARQEFFESFYRELVIREGEQRAEALVGGLE